MKKAGLLDSIPRKQNIKPADKTRITKLANQFKQVLKKPDDFAIRSVSKQNADVLKKSGYKVKNGKAIIPLADGRNNRYDSVKIGKGTLEYSRKGKKNKIYLSGDAKTLMKKAAQLQSKRGRNQTVTFSLRGFAVSSTDYDSYEAMMTYLQNVIMPKVVMSQKKTARKAGEKFTKKQAEREFWSSVSIVTIGDKIEKRADWSDDDEEMDF